VGLSPSCLPDNQYIRWHQNGALTTRRGAELVYKYVDQDVIDGAVNLSGKSAEESGQALRPLQSGKVQQYGALLFGAAAIGVLILVITV
jgi:NADH-quinone oxidoreductase subunit L